MTTLKIQFSRADYLAKKCTHQQYYSQFVNDTIQSRVKGAFGIDAIKDAMLINENLNTIPIGKWDVLANNLYNVSGLLKDAGDFLTLAGGVCIAKEAARQLVATN